MKDEQEESEQNHEMRWNKREHKSNLLLYLLLALVCLVLAYVLSGTAR